MANRITAAIEKRRKDIETKVASGEITPAKLDNASKSLVLSDSEHARFQTLKSESIGVSLNIDEAQSLYGYLGESVSVFNAQPLYVRAVLLLVFNELLARRIKGR